MVAERAIVRAGPGLGYYPTQILPQKTVVEVYYEDPNGWLAIRPPEGSYSWVQAADVRVAPDGVAEVLREGAPSYVGSLLGSSRDYAPVRLRKGELLQLIDVPSAAQGGTGGSVSGDRWGSNPLGPEWVRVLPPSGEFRWIEAGAVRFVGAEELDLTAWDGSSSSAEVAGADAEVGATSERSHSGWQRLELGATTSPRNLEERSQSPAAKAPVHPASGSNGRREVLGENYGHPSVSSPLREWIARAEARPFPHEGGTVSSASGSFQDRLDRLHLEFAQTLLRPLGEWQFSELLAAAENLVATVPAGQLREEAKDLVKRIQWASQIRQRFEQQILPSSGVSSLPYSPEDPSMGGVPSRMQERGITGATTPARSEQDDTFGIGRRHDLGATGQTASDRFRPVSDSPSAQGAPLSPSGRFDAVGRLMRVIPAAWGVPRYALVDEGGNICAFLTPAAGLNLEYYLGSQIGVNGNCSVYGEKQTLHVMVKSVTPLERLSQR